MLAYLLISPLFANFLLLLNSFHPIVNLISRILNKIDIVYRYTAELSNRIAFLFSSKHLTDIRSLTHLSTITFLQLN